MRATSSWEGIVHCAARQPPPTSTARIALIIEVAVTEMMARCLRCRSCRCIDGNTLCGSNVHENDFVFAMIRYHDAQRAVKATSTPQLHLT